MKKLFTLLFISLPFFLMAQDTLSIKGVPATSDEELKELRARYATYTKKVKKVRQQNAPNPDLFTWDNAQGNNKKTAAGHPQKSKKDTLLLDNLYIGPTRLSGSAPKDKSWENKLKKGIKTN